MLDAAAAKLDAGSLAGQKEAEARVRATLGHAYAGLAPAQPRRAAVPQVARAAPRAARPPGPPRHRPHDERAGQRARGSRPAAHEGGRAAGHRRRWTCAAACGAATTRKSPTASTRSRPSAASSATTSPPSAGSTKRWRCAAGSRSDAKTKHGLASSLTHRAILKWRKGELTATIERPPRGDGALRGHAPRRPPAAAALHLRLGNAFDSAGQPRRGDPRLPPVRRRPPPPPARVARRHRRAVPAGGGAHARRRDSSPTAEAFLLDRERASAPCPTAPPDLRSELYGQFVGLYQAWGKPEKIAAVEQAAAGVARPRDRRRPPPRSTPTRQQGPAVRRPRQAARPRRPVRTGAAEFRPRARLDPTDHWPWFYQGCLLAYLGDETGLPRALHEMLDRFGTSPDSARPGLHREDLLAAARRRRRRPGRASTRSPTASGHRRQRRAQRAMVPPDEGHRQYRAGSPEPPSTGSPPALPRPRPPHRHRRALPGDGLPPARQGRARRKRLATAPKTASHASPPGPASATSPRAASRTGSSARPPWPRARC